MVPVPGCLGNGSGLRILPSEGPPSGSLVASLPVDQIRAFMHQVSEAVTKGKSLEGVRSVLLQHHWLPHVFNEAVDAATPPDSAPQSAGNMVPTPPEKMT